MKKRALYLILFLLVGLGAFIAALQTPYAKKKIQEWIEAKADGALTIGKIEGVLPFWIRLVDVRYSHEEIEARADDVRLFLIPTSLLFGKLTIHSLYTDSLSINQFHTITLKGSGEIGKDFSLRLELNYEETRFTLDLEGDREEKRIGLIARVQQEEILDIWTNGIYNWETRSYTGEMHGGLLSWNVKSAFSLADSLLTLSAFSIQKGDLKAEGSGTYDPSSNRFQSLGNFLDIPYSVQGESEWAEKTLNLKNLNLTYAKDRLHGDLSYNLKSQTITGELALEFNDLTRYGIEGKGKGQLSFLPGSLAFSLMGEEMRWREFSFSGMEISGELKEGLLSSTLSLSDFIIHDPSYEVFPTVHLKMEGNATTERVNLEGEMRGLGDAPFKLKATIPILLTYKPFDININPNAPFAISLQGKGSINPILAFLENASVVAQGDLDVDLSLTGTWNNPHLEGTLIYENGRVESLVTGALFRDIRVVLEGEGRALKIRSMSAHDYSRGDLSGTGQIEWSPQEGFPFTFTLYTSRFTLLAADPLSLNLDSQLTLTGNIHEMAIQGNATVVEGHLAIPNKIPPQIPTLEVTYINPLPTPKPEIEEKSKPIPIYWDVELTIPKNLTIEGRGLVSEWRGQLRLQGYQEELNYTGKLKLVQGRFSAIGRTFDLVEGKILIEGASPKDIFVDLQGDLELATITASLCVAGSLDALQISFTSTPPMSTNQILSWILFNQDVNELSPFQAYRLANAIVQLSGKYAGPGVLNNIKDGLGIDVFDITNCDFDSNDFTFQIGKYISQGTFVGVSKSFSGDFDSILIQTRLYRNFYLEGDYGGSLNGLTPNGGKLIFKWYKSY